MTRSRLALVAALAAAGSVAALAIATPGATAKPVDHPPVPPRAQATTPGQPAVESKTAAAVRAWEGTMTLPTYEEDPPDVNAPFDLFTTSRFNYPYTIRDRLTSRRVLRRWRTLANADRSASIWVGNIDRVYGGQWRVALTLRPREAVLEQRTYLYNASPPRHRFYWWTNAAVRVTDDSRILYPTRYTASHQLQ